MANGRVPRQVDPARVDGANLRPPPATACRLAPQQARLPSHPRAFSRMRAFSNGRPSLLLAITVARNGNQRNGCLQPWHGQPPSVAPPRGRTVRRVRHRSTSRRRSTYDSYADTPRTYDSYAGTSRRVGRQQTLHRHCGAHPLVQKAGMRAGVWPLAGRWLAAGWPLVGASRRARHLYSAGCWLHRMQQACERMKLSGVGAGECERYLRTMESARKAVVLPYSAVRRVKAGLPRIPCLKTDGHTS